MDFKRHLEFQDRHAFLSASQHAWLNYTPEKLVDRYATRQAAARGTRLHNLANLLIKDGIKLPNTMQTLNMYVNHCIGYRMKTEQVLVWSENCFGTVDAIQFEGKVLRIFDLKTGLIPGKIYQLLVYAALFCLEYGVNPKDIEFDLRIYQFDDIERYEVDAEEIQYIMDWIKQADLIIKEMDKEEV